ncbi:hypothetical protein H0H93_011465 [Arthromyces matolae]|nr:hypothetical protein H0H93_011465 [Arthromyces matolae]
MRRSSTTTGADTSASYHAPSRSRPISKLSLGSSHVEFVNQVSSPLNVERVATVDLELDFNLEVEVTRSSRELMVE